MGGQAMIGRIAGIPIVLDFSLIILILLWGLPYFKAGSGEAIVIGLALVLGLLASILLHELGHAFSGRWYGVDASHIELNGLGGLCYWATGLPPGILPRVAISAAGPLANLALYFLFDGLATALRNQPDGVGVLGGLDRLRFVCGVLGDVNFSLFLFNLLPAQPLDGGKIMEALLSHSFGASLANRIVGFCGLALGGLFLVGVFSIGPLQYGTFALVIAFLLLINNAFALEGGGPPWKRRN